jgi:hypothetical protein
MKSDQKLPALSYRVSHALLGPLLKIPRVSATNRSHEEYHHEEPHQITLSLNASITDELLAG